MSLNILIVDDSNVIRSMIERAMRMAGVPIGEMHQARDGAEALNLLGRNWIDLVLADINMPVMDGVTMIETMSTDVVLSRIPVIVVSTEGSETKMNRLRQYGVRAFVHKPFTPESIRGVIYNVMGGWEDEQPCFAGSASNDSF